MVRKAWQGNANLYCSWFQPRRKRFKIAHICAVEVLAYTLERKGLPLVYLVNGEEHLPEYFSIFQYSLAYGIETRENRFDARNLVAKRSFSSGWLRRYTPDAQITHIALEARFYKALNINNNDQNEMVTLCTTSHSPTLCLRGITLRHRKCICFATTSEPESRSQRHHQASTSRSCR